MIYARLRTCVRRGCVGVRRGRRPECVRGEGGCERRRRQGFMKS
jgi:hypothetical protein